MTPMIDVIFQLLIFFICTSSFQLPEKLFATPIQSLMGNGPSESAQTFVLPEDPPSSPPDEEPQPAIRQTDIATTVRRAKIFLMLAFFNMSPPLR